MKKTPSEHLSYEAAWAELQSIVEELQSEKTGIDALAEKVERAAVLANFCRERLRQTEEQLEKLTRD
jgi:exodeoxyribonuclease VII small subunit